MAHGWTMSSKVSRLFQKWPCFGGKAVREDVDENSFKRNHPKIVITECKSAESTPNISRKNSSSSSSSSSSSNSSSTPYNEMETEIKIKTDGQLHEMGLKLVLKTKDCDGDEVDGGVIKEETTSMISVKDVKLGSFAHGFGIREGDMVSKVNGKRCAQGQELKDAFLSNNSDQLEMEIYRKKRNPMTRRIELIKMVISNARRIGGQTENELEIIQVEMGSRWTLSDNETYFHQDHVDKVDLQFACLNTPWVVTDGRRLVLRYQLPVSEEESARFHIHYFWSMSNDTGIPVVIQHKQSGLYVAFDHESIYLEEVHDIAKIEGQKPYLFNMHTELAEGDGKNITFQSLLDRSHYIGFNAHGEMAHAEPIHVEATSRDYLGNAHEKVVFIR